MAVNGEAPTTAKPSSTILQGIGTGTVVKLEFTSEPQAVSAITEAGQSSSVSASQSKVQTVSVAVKARDAQKMSRAAELLEAWKLDPSELVYGDKVGAGGQADVYLGRWQVSSRTSQPISAPAASVRKPIPTFCRGCPSRSRSSVAATSARRARRRCAPSPRPCAGRCVLSRACATQTWSGCTERAWSSRPAS